MSIKSLLQIILFLLIILILGSIYYIYFFKKNLEKEILITKEIVKIDDNKIEVDEGADQQVLDEIKQSKDKKLEIETKKSEINKKNKSSFEIKENKKMEKPEDLKNLTKEIQYITTNKNGDIFEILAEFGKTNLENSDVLDLEIVEGTIKSQNRSKINITSDFGQYNYTNQNSKFYSNVKITYDNKIITSDNLDINITENLAIAYNNVNIKDEISLMKAQIVIMDIITKDIEINSQKKIEIFTN